jgi:hypothetical protein
VLYLAYIQPVRFPVDPIMGSIMLIFLVRAVEWVVVVVVVIVLVSVVALIWLPLKAT